MVIGTAEYWAGMMVAAMAARRVGELVVCWAAVRVVM